LGQPHGRRTSRNDGPKTSRHGGEPPGKKGGAKGGPILKEFNTKKSDIVGEGGGRKKNGKGERGVWGV